MSRPVSFYSSEFLCEDCQHHLFAHYDDERGNRHCMACGGGCCIHTTSDPTVKTFGA